MQSDRRRTVLRTRTITISALVVLGVTVGSGFLLFYLYPPADSARALDVIRTAGSLGVGTGGAAALLLTARRQQSTERANEDSWHDATERRISELQSKAGEQLGSDKAAVRLNALYQLERLAQNHKEHRQTIVNVICAYLRMPFDYRKEPDGDKTEESLNGIREELQVRLTAQRIIADHLRDDRGRDESPSGKRWEGIDLNLRGATLIEFDLSGCVLHSANFENSTLVHSANFDGTKFFGSFDLSDAECSGRSVSFVKTEFHSDAAFIDTLFQGGVYFSRASFRGRVSFASTDFALSSSFNDCHFEKTADFTTIMPRKLLEFEGSKFARYVLFDQIATFDEVSNIDLSGVQVCYSPKADVIEFERTSLPPRWTMSKPFIDADNGVQWARIIRKRE